MTLDKYFTFVCQNGGGGGICARSPFTLWKTITSLRVSKWQNWLVHVGQGCKYISLEVQLPTLIAEDVVWMEWLIDIY